MGLFRVNLNVLAVASARVTVRSFGAIDQNALFSYGIWVLDQLHGVPSATNDGVWQAIRNAAERLVVLMPGGVSDYVEFAAEKIIDMRKDGDLPVFPIMNQDIKSDAWLTGLVAKRLAEKGRNFNQDNIGFAIDGKTLGVVTKRATTVVRQDCKVVLIDDASYSGTQAMALMGNAGACGIFDMAKIKGAALVLAGISTVAKEKLKVTNIPIFAQCDPMPSGPFGSSEVLSAMRSLPVTANRASASAGVYASHREVNPDLLVLQPTTGELPTFLDLSYAIPPYKIPDSLSVPTHMLMACGYLNNDFLPRVMYNARLPTTLGHLFTGSGSINYRTTLRSERNSFLVQI